MIINRRLSVTKEDDNNGDGAIESPVVKSWIELDWLNQSSDRVLLKPLWFYGIAVFELAVKALRDFERGGGEGTKREK